MSKKSVLMIGSGRKVRGGIASVITAYTKNAVWGEFNCRWLETHSDINNGTKIWVALLALMKAPFLMSRSDMVHIHTASDVSMYRKTIFLTIAMVLRKKVIIHLHAADDDSLFGRPLFYVARHVFSHADLVVVLSEYWDKLVHTISPDAHTCIIPNPCDIQYAATKKATDGNNTILFAGKLEARKGFTDLIEAMPKVLSRVADAKLILAGHGEIELGQAIASRLGINSSVFFPGWLAGAEKESIFKESSVFCLPSHKEGVPMAMLDAVGYGLPIIVTPVGGIPDIIENGFNGLLVSPGDKNAIADAIVSVLTDTELSQKLIKNAKNTISRKYCTDTICNLLRATYNNM